VDERCPPTELSLELQDTLGNVAYHAKQLAEFGLLALDSTQQRRGALEHFYRAVGE
jgi:hypothetical protein